MHVGIHPTFSWMSLQNTLVLKGKASSNSCPCIFFAKTGFQQGCGSPQFLLVFLFANRNSLGLAVFCRAGLPMAWCQHGAAYCKLMALSLISLHTVHVFWGRHFFRCWCWPLVNTSWQDIPKDLLQTSWPTNPPHRGLPKHPSLVTSRACSLKSAMPPAIWANVAEFPPADAALGEWASWTVTFSLVVVLQVGA